MNIVRALVLGALLVNTYGWQPTLCGGPGTTTSQITKWGKEVTPDKVLPEYPRPQMARPNWKSLNGLWEFDFGKANDRPPFGKPLTQQILVPFPPESCLSGIGKTGMHLWYRNMITPPFKSNRTLLHFEKVDWQTTVFVAGKEVATHFGGYDAFWIDVTEYFQTSSPVEVLVQVYDPSDKGPQPAGKQRISAIKSPGGDTYTPTSGIWSNVWLENVPKVDFISELRMLTDMKGIDITVQTAMKSGQQVTVQVKNNNQIVATGNGKADKAFRVNVPNPTLWEPGNPFLYDVDVFLAEIDHVASYTGLREIALGHESWPGTPSTGPQNGIDRPGSDMPGSPFKLPKADPDLCWAACNTTKGCEAWAYGIPKCDDPDYPQCWLKHAVPSSIPDKCRISGSQGRAGGPVTRPYLNGKPVYYNGWLDQGFWPDGIYRPPTDEALKFDLQAILTFGLNMVRKHQKVEPDRWYYWADKLGILIWQDAVQKYGGASAATIPHFMSDLTKMITGPFANHPSIVQWDVFNEEDCVGVFHNVTQIVEYVKKTDPSRLVDTNSGGPKNNLHVGDVDDVHDYPFPNEGAFHPSQHQFSSSGECGGFGYFTPGKEWSPKKCHTYDKSSSPQDQISQYSTLMDDFKKLKGIVSATVYTQITDVELECDGYLNYDRTSKFNANQTKQLVMLAQSLTKYKP